VTWPYVGAARPPRAHRPEPGEPIGPGRALLLLLDSIPTAQHPEGPIEAPLDAEEVELFSRVLGDLTRR